MCINLYVYKFIYVNIYTYIYTWCFPILEKDVFWNFRPVQGSAAKLNLTARAQD